MLDLTSRSHPLRAALSAEMHVRRLPRIEGPCRLLQVVTLYGEGGAAAGRAHITSVGADMGVEVASGARYAILPVGGLTLVWEGHTEAATFTFICPGAFDAPFDPALFDSAEPALAELPGDVIRATQIAILGKGAALPDGAALDALFRAQALIVCDVAGGAARLMSDFMLHDDGYGRLLIADRGLEGDETSQLVTRVQELGNYRNLALLGLPAAQALTPEITALEKRLAALTHEVSGRAANDDALLDELSFVSAELARLAAATRYRMSATRAYGQLSTERLASLQIAAVRGYQTLGDFTERRLVPALRTCESFSRRIDDLQQRAAWTSSLLRTRVDIALAMQNRDLLTSMDRRNETQLRLQHTVEGLSVVAISYYLVSLIGYASGAFHGLPHDLVMAGAVPVVLGAAWAAMRLVRQRLADH
jgi:uncharacterized membrane-anchored protein